MILFKDYEPRIFVIVKLMWMLNLIKVFRSVYITPHQIYNNIKYLHSKVGRKFWETLSTICLFSYVITFHEITNKMRLI